MSRRAKSDPGSSPMPQGGVWSDEGEIVAPPFAESTPHNVLGQFSLTLVFRADPPLPEDRRTLALLTNLIRTSAKARRRYESAASSLRSAQSGESKTQAVYDAVSYLEDAVSAAHRSALLVARLHTLTGKGVLVLREGSLPRPERRAVAALDRVRDAIEHLDERIGDDSSSAWSLIPTRDRLWIHGWEIAYSDLRDVIEACLSAAEILVTHGHTPEPVARLT